MTSEEFFAAYTGFDRSAKRTPGEPHIGGPVPDGDVDWRAKGAVTPIKNQGQCGSCWSFSTTGSVEGNLAIQTGNLTSLSEEDLVQCDQVDQGCQGGLMDNAFQYIEKNGIAAESAYPYTSGTGIRGMCNSAPAKVVTITGYRDVPQGNETALLSAVAQQPVSIAIEADKSAFQMYKSGVLDSPFCGKQLDHGVLIVGYGTQKGVFGTKDYWIVKNSWGETWGEQGYINIVRGKNMCGIAEQASYPTGAKKM
jgi:C1A family cysteine protease